MLEHAGPGELVQIGYQAATEYCQFDVAEIAWRRGAAHGDVFAMFNLAVLLEDRGEGVEAEQWYRKAAERDDGRAGFDLAGVEEDRGKNVEAEDCGEDVEAKQTYRRAAERGDAATMASLGLLHAERGEDVEVEPGEQFDADGDAGSSRPLWMIAAIALLVGGALLSIGILFTVSVRGGDGNRSAAFSSVPAITRTAAPSPVRTCRDNMSQFTHVLRTEVDHEGDELGAINDAALVDLGRAALRQPSVLETTRLVPFQRLRLLEAANAWLCH